jgi:hypothetical protein
VRGAGHRVDVVEFKREQILRGGVGVDVVAAVTVEEDVNRYCGGWGTGPPFGLAAAPREQNPTSKPLLQS